MNRTLVTALIEGRATVEGTRRFQKRFARQYAGHFFRSLGSGSMVSSLGLGSYLGECDDAEDARYTAATVAAIEKGVNLIDTAINYRCQRSERAIGDALRNAIGSGAVERDELVVCTKGGYVPLDRSPPATREDYREFLEEKYFQRGVMQESDVVAGGHCLTPRYLEDQINRSRANLGLEVIDIYYVHNPEQQLEVLDRPAFLDVMRQAFMTLESQVRKGTIAAYGCASWNGFRGSADAKTHLALEELVAIARDVGGPKNHFSVVQLPINLAMTEAVRVATQCVAGETVTLVEAARHFGLSVIGSATLMQSQLTRSLPQQVKEAFPGFHTDARRAIAFSQSLPIASALVGMRSLDHLEQNLARPNAR
jgi:aryl-alcohol dehydrogenase-like predicted oxidoreductase